MRYFEIGRTKSVQIRQRAAYVLALWLLTVDAGGCTPTPAATATEQGDATTPSSGMEPGGENGGSSGMGNNGQTTGAQDGGPPPATPPGSRPVIYQLPVRLFGNLNLTMKTNGTLAENGVGKFADINDAALDSIKALGVTWVYLTGVYRQATLTDWSSLHPDMGPDDPDAVKGIAGSFFAVRDYYDVCPDYAVEPAKRMEEFDQLVDRIHAHGMKVMIDLVPNHVARGYKTVSPGKASFGAADDQSVTFSANNDFYYIQSGALKLPMTDWTPPSAVGKRDGAYPNENGSAERRAKYTGDNVTVANPSASNWYETIKLNYGASSFVSPAWWAGPALDPSVSPDQPPRTWTAMADVIRFWLTERDVDGFRADLVNMLPDEPLRYLVAQGHAAKPGSFFIAEVYGQFQRYFETGFDAVYYKDPWDAFKAVSLAPTPENNAALQLEAERALGQMPYYDLGNDAKLFRDHKPGERAKLMTFLENHDEARVASTLKRGNPGASGWVGGARAHLQMAPLLLLSGNGPVLLFAGSEVAESADGVEGYPTDDNGRTTMFDYWALPTLAKWSNEHAYDGAGLSTEQAAHRRWYGKLLALAQQPAFMGEVFWGLDGYNATMGNVDYPGELFSYVRCAEGGKALAIVVGNLGLDGNATVNGKVRLPPEVVSRCGLDPSASLAVTIELSDESGAEGFEPTSAGSVVASALSEVGLPVSVRGRSTSVYLVQ